MENKADALSIPTAFEFASSWKPKDEDIGRTHFNPLEKAGTLSVDGKEESEKK